MKLLSIYCNHLLKLHTIFVTQEHNRCHPDVWYWMESVRPTYRTADSYVCMHLYMYTYASRVCNISPYKFVDNIVAATYSRTEPPFFDVYFQEMRKNFNATCSPLF